MANKGAEALEIPSPCKDVKVPSNLCFGCHECHYYQQGLIFKIKVCHSCQI